MGVNLHGYDTKNTNNKGKQISGLHQNLKKKNCAAKDTIKKVRGQQIE